MVNALTDKFAGFCAVTPNKKFFRLFKRAGVKNILISYHYIRKDPTFTKVILEYVKENNGLFMTDSGVFSFLNDKTFDIGGFDWEAYVIEYTNWLHDHSEYVFSACNLDMDLALGHDQIVEWNERYFHPLEAKMNIIYVAHPLGVNKLEVVREYAKQYDYIAVNENLAGYVGEIATIARNSRCAVHGLAWTKPTLLQEYPFTTVDSSSWVNYQKFGATVWFDGKNFYQYDNNKKHERKNLQKYCKKYGVKFYEFVNEVDAGSKPPKHNDDEGLTFSLMTWTDVFDWLKKTANRRLKVTIGDLMANKDFQHDKPPIQVVSTTGPEEETEFEELDENGAVIPSKKKSLADRLDELPGVGDSDLQGNTYLQREDGSQVVVYKKRGDPTLTVDQVFSEAYGNTLFCDTCVVQDKCPKFEKGMACAFNFKPAFVTSNPLATLDFIISAQMERVQRMMLFESLEGGQVNKTLSYEIGLLEKLNASRVNLIALAQLKNLTMGGRDTSALQDPAVAGEASFANILLGMMNKPK